MALANSARDHGKDEAAFREDLMNIARTTLSSKLLKKRETKPWLYRKTEPFFERTNDAYRRTSQKVKDYVQTSGKDPESLGSGRLAFVYVYQDR